MPGLPTPRTPTDQFLAAIHDRLGELLDRLPARTQGERAGGGVALREPAARVPVGGVGASPSQSPEGESGSGAGQRRPARPAPKTRKRTTKPKEA